ELADVRKDPGLACPSTPVGDNGSFSRKMKGRAPWSLGNRSLKALPRRSLPRHEQQLSGLFASLVTALGLAPNETRHIGNAKGPPGDMEMRLEMQRQSRRAIPGRRT